MGRCAPLSSPAPSRIAPGERATVDAAKAEGSDAQCSFNSLGLGIQKDDVYTLDFTHFFNENVAVELAYTTTENESELLDIDVNSYQLGVTVQF